VLAVHALWGHYTCSLNLCPSEIASEWTFALAGHEYKFDAFGNPTNRPHIAQCLTTIAENPVACAHFLHGYLKLFADKILGWPMGSDRQVDATCLFGAILAAYLKYEAGPRGGLHAHGQLLQQLLQAAALLKMVQEGTALQAHLFAFMESVMMAYFPTPVVDPSPLSTRPMPSTPSVVTVAPEAVPSFTVDWAEQAGVMPGKNATNWRWRWRWRRRWRLSLTLCLALPP
jgi:hypothetical protein